MRPSVTGLLRGGSPSTVVGRIGAISVIAFECQAPRRFRPHVREKVGKRVTPSITNNDTASTVVAITGHLVVVAAISHVEPRRVFRCAATREDRVTVCQIGEASHISSVATAATSVAGREFTRHQFSDRSAFASARPDARTTSCPSGQGDDGKTAKLLSGEVDKWLRHERTLSRNTYKGAA